MHGCQFFSPDRRLCEVVDAFWDIDVADAELARTMTIKVLPTTSPLLAIHYRAAMGSTRDPHYSRIAAGIQSGTVTVRPGGAIGAVLVRLKTQSASRILGLDLAALMDTSVGLDHIFTEAEVSRLEQMLAEARNAGERVSRVESFLLGQVGARAADSLVERAMLLLKRNPAMAITRLAAHLEVSERQLRRRFTAVTGTSPKMFARVARFEKIIAARLNGGRWGDIAYAAGYNDQAHLVNEFSALVGISPEAFFRRAVATDHRGLNGWLARSDFYNTFVSQVLKDSISAV
jgi:AraC-like DNA-binding protein